MSSPRRRICDDFEFNPFNRFTVIKDIMEYPDDQVRRLAVRLNTHIELILAIAYLTGKDPELVLDALETAHKKHHKSVYGVIET